MEIISGTEAIQRMRAMRIEKEGWFVLHHLTWNDTTQTTNGLRIVKRCRLRPSLPGELYKKHSDLYLPYFDLDKNKNGNCRKVLIRAVAFPPDYKLIKVSWFLQNK